MNGEARTLDDLASATVPAVDDVADGTTAAGGGPQARFDDLYSAVYRILDDAKTTHRLVKLYKGSHASTRPHPLVPEAGATLLRHRRGLFGYAAHQVVIASHEPAAAPWRTYDRLHRPRVPVAEAFRLLAGAGRRDGESLTDYTAHVVARRHHLGHYRGGSTGYDDESRAFLAAHFTGQGMPVHPDEVLIFCGGAKGAFIAACASLMCTRAYDRLHHQGGLVLAPQGYYQSLRLIPAIFGGDITVTDQLTPAAVRDWVAATTEIPGRIIYVPLVNNATGEVLDRARAHGIARAVLAHNQHHLANPVHVIADDVYVGSYLHPELTPTPIGSVAGAHLGDATLGRMSDWTVTVVSPSKTFALPTSRVAFATTTSARLRAALAHYRTVFSFGRVPQVDEIMATAALCLTPQSWIDRWNQHYRATAQRLTGQLDALNTELGGPVFTLSPPQGGWYMTLGVSAELFPPAVTTGVDAFAVCLHYQPDEPDSGIALLPGELFGFGLAPATTRDAVHTLRGTLAVDDATLDEFVRRLRDLALVMRRPDAPDTVQRALNRARRVADTTRILHERTF